MSLTRLMAAGRVRSVTICKLLLVNVYNYSGSKLDSGGQFAYQTALRRYSLALLRWDLFTQQTSLIGKIIFQLLWIWRRVCVLCGLSVHALAYCIKLKAP